MLKIITRVYSIDRPFSILTRILRNCKNAQKLSFSLDVVLTASQKQKVSSVTLTTFVVPHRLFDGGFK